MHTIYEICDDRNNHLVMVEDHQLANRISVGVAGNLSRNPGSIRELNVFKSFEDLPENIQNAVLKQEASHAIEKRDEIVGYLSKLSETERDQAIDYLSGKNH